MMPQTEARTLHHPVPPPKLMNDNQDDNLKSRILRQSSSTCVL